MYFVLFEATPCRNVKRVAGNTAGAYVSCYIQRATRDEAIQAAKAGIEAEGWIVDEPDEAYMVDDSTYPPGKEGRDYYQQALIDREVFVFHCFPDTDGEFVE